jgi:hypothetical protein
LAQRADLYGCNIYGVSVWGVKLDEKTNQSNLLIQNYNEPLIRVPSLEMAQLIYMLLEDRTKLRELLCGIGERGVLILGRFEPKRKEILNAVADVLTERGYLPILFDFDEIPGRNNTETIVLLAGMSKFIIADLTMPSRFHRKHRRSPSRLISRSFPSSRRGMILGRCCAISLRSARWMHGYSAIKRRTCS